MAEYIDKTALLEKVIIPSISSVLDGNTAERIKKLCVDTVKNTPSADVALIEHGAIFTGFGNDCGHQYCTSCHYEIEWKSYPKYCPNCGARMDGDT